ncbi:MAG TPA: hypothetical protein PK953_09430 [Smithellaceae bacterium]|jgi:hypothetical protein|nr:hypothetical protein [Bacillota bacterium]HQC11120.1 hypothetical protein [Smithellaceae bacterium]
MSKKKDEPMDLEVVKPKVEAIVCAAFESDAGAGFENASSDCYAIPYLQILQKGSPQCDDDNNAHIDGAVPGQIFNNVTQKRVDGQVGVLVVPVHMHHRFVEWVPRTSGGGFKGTYDPNDPLVLKAKNNRDESGKLILENGNYLADTRYHFCLVLDEDGSMAPVVIGMTSTQLRKSRNWMTQMQNIQFRRADGSSYIAPSYSHVYRLTTVGESNEKGGWKGWKISLERRLNPSDPADAAIVEYARTFRKQLMDGRAQVAPMDDELSAGSNDASF